ncbi:AAA domain-containing protein [Psychrobacter jeotgali]|uniref:AAA domain-containing protein n=1 Tax=Psychrobacter jeotgali TaxID=179010 RepID=UPI00191B31BC|nr:AAA domain-containing protein [Psychrobacter jeotgali]
MSQTLPVFYEQMSFDSMRKLYDLARIPLPFPNDIESWAEMLNQPFDLKNLASAHSDQEYYVLLEFVKRGAKKGYVVLAIPVTIDIPESGQASIYLLPSITKTITLNAEYYLGEHNQDTPEIQLNDTSLSYKSLSYSLQVGTSQTWFHQACRYLYASCQVDSLRELQEKIRQQLKGQEIKAKLSLVEKPNNKSKHSLLKLYEGLLSDGASAYQQTPLPKLLSVYDAPSKTNQNKAFKCRTADLYKNFLNTARGKYDPDIPYLLGHMDTQKGGTDDNNDPVTRFNNRELFPLDNTQRHASLAAAYLDKNYSHNSDYGRVLAVNGPPGSGKTSMLKAVVAHYVVKAALLKEPCPIIVASGATNQSVKNVTSAFPDVVQDDNDEWLLEYQRWIPHCPTYGSFFASQNAEGKLSHKEKEQIPILVIAGKDKPYNFGWKGVGERLNALYANDELAVYYLKKAKVFFNQRGLSEPTNIQQVVDGLHHLLSYTYLEMADALHNAKAQLFSDNADLDKVFPLHQEEHHLSALKSTREDLIKLYKHDDVKVYEKVCREIISDEAIKPEYYPLVLRKAALNLLIEQCIDLEYRTQMFHLAARYWEGQFIIDQASNLHFSRTEDNIIAGLRRVCMITPVIISTVNRLPSLLKITSYPPGAMQRDYAYGGIDLLITDESGQAPIMSALPVAALTKRLISVGDVLQLAPVIDTQKDVSAFDEYLIWLKYGYSSKQIAVLFKQQLSVSHGSFLHVVQESSSLNYQGKGFMLRGHYRCYRNIIDYCNRLVYEEKLFYIPPLDKDRKDEGLPAMAYVESTGSSSKGGGGSSKQNKDEAEMIAQLVLENYKQWQELLKDDDKVPRLQDMLAIITPFNKQPDCIQDALVTENSAQGKVIPEQEIAETIINTIHTLQGAEKDIIIYSGVQSHDDSETLFFEDQPYLLNVAVSRAKQSFIAFLSPTLYKLNSPEVIGNKNFQTTNSIHYLGWYMANYGVRLFPNYLFIVEAPGKVKSLKNILKSDYIVYATGGAITNMDLEDASFETAGQQLRPQYQLTSNGEKTLKKILTEGSRVQKIYLATDDDNVGETIAWHLRHHTKQREPQLIEKIERVALRSITEEGVKEAISNSREISKPQVTAEIARQIIDRWLAQYMMQLLSEKLPNDHVGKKGMGRVKAVILDLIAKHEESVKRRKSSALKVKLTVNNRQVSGYIQNVPKDYLEKVARHINSMGEPIDGDSQKYRLVDVQTEEVSCEPFNRSTLDVMSLAWQRYGIKPAATMRILQRLYEGNI